MRRKSLCIAVCISMVLLLLPDSPIAGAEGAGSKIVRVKLSMGSPTTLSLFVDGNYSVAGNDAVTLERQLYTVKLESGRLNLYYGSALKCGGASLRLVQRAATSGRNNFVWLKNAVYGYAGYLGDMEFAVSSGGIAVINRVYIEDYLYGVVPHEMNNSWPIEALKAQAIAARNYVMAAMGRPGLYDVVDTSADQVYKGYNAANTNSIRAVDQTAKTVLTCGGKLVQIFYSASNGGYTEIPQHIWTASAAILPYHIIHPDPYDVQNPYSLQEVLIFPKTIAGGSKIAYRCSSGGAMVPGSGDEAANAEKYLKQSALSAVKAMGYIANAADDIRIAGVIGITPRAYMSQHDIRDYTGNDACVCFRYADVDMSVLARQTPGGAQIPITVRCAIDMTLLDDEDGTYQAFDYNASALRLFAVEQTDADWRIYHRRYGHGVGLSQRGAQQRAESPDPEVNTFDRILTFYYPNTDITAQDYASPALLTVNQPDSTNAAAACPNTTLNVRSSPGSSSTGNILGALPDGARLRVTQQNVSSGWHKIIYGNRDAYVSASYVHMDSPSVTTPAPSPDATSSATPATSPALSPTPAPSSIPGSLGDVNGDGVVSISDYTLVRLAILGIRELTGPELAAADINLDGSVSISDYTLIRLNILGLREAS